MSTPIAQETEKNLGGRPTDYRPEYGDQILFHMGEEGLSLSAAAAAMGHHRRRIYDWYDAHEEFAEKVDQARGKRLEYLERRLMNANMPAAQITAMIFALKTADKHEWREKIDIEHTGKDGGAIQTEHTQTSRLVIDASTLTLENLEALKQAALASQPKMIEG